MKKLLLVLVCVALAAFLFVGCLPEWITPGDDEEEEVPVLAMEANVDAVLINPVYEEPVEGEEEVPVEIKPHRVAWSIENTGDLFIREYMLTFDVFYPMETKDNILFEVVGNYLEIGAKHEGILDLVKYDTPEIVSVSWELFN